MPLILLVLACILAAQAQQPGGEAAKNPFAGRPEVIEQARDSFVEACSPCHGPNGEGGHGPSLVEGTEIRRASDQQLFDSIRKGVPGTEMPPYPFADDRVWRLVTFVRSLSAPAIDANVGGDVSAGEAIFFGKGGCTGCHRIEGRGGFLGPDLSDLGTKRTVGQLRESLLKPNERITDGFRAVTFRAPDGEEVRGVAKYQTNYSARVIDSKGKLHRLDKKDFETASFSDQSWMPSDYSERLDAAEIQNLLAYLSRRSVREESHARR